MKSSNVVWHAPVTTRVARERRNGHKGVIIWFTGLSGAGKSTLAHALEDSLHTMGCHTFTLDGDNVRHGLCGDLGFSDEDRVENIRRVGEMSKLFIEAGTITLTAFISPFTSDREKVRELVADGDLIEVYTRCSLEECEARDVKGLYKKARAGEIPHFTGISSPYEEPENPEIVIDTDKHDVDECTKQILKYLKDNGFVNTN